MPGTQSFRLGNVVSAGGSTEVFAEVDDRRYPLGRFLDAGTTVDSLIASWESSEQRLSGAIATALESDNVLSADATLLAPVVRPSKILLIGANYRDHCEEAKLRIPTEPLILSKPPSGLVGSRGTISWDPSDTSQVDLEVELAIIIGRTAKRISAEEAPAYVFGYTAGNDVSARDLQIKDRQWVRAKSLDTFCPLGPVIVRDPTLDPGGLAISSSINGNVMQNSNTSQMIFGVADIVSYISRYICLNPGDVILTGTPAGVGLFKEPPIFLSDGDLVEVSIEGIGTLSSVCGTQS